MPSFVEPMAPRQVAELPTSPEWIYEVKWDGYRGLAIKHGDASRLLSRNDKSLASEFPGVAAAIKTLRTRSALLDGEIVALTADGRPSFQALQDRTRATAIVYYAFDLLTLDGKDWRHRPLEDRKAKLEEIASGTEVRISSSFPGPPTELLRQARAMELEGIIAKRLDSAYRSGPSPAWLKLKLSLEQEFVVGGYRPGTPLESLLVGYYEGGNLMYAGTIRQGLHAANRRLLATALTALKSRDCPFSNLPNSRKGHWGEGVTLSQMERTQWVIPHLVVQVSFTEWTKAGNLRHPAFRGLRPDKLAAAVIREHAVTKNV